MSAVRKIFVDSRYRHTGTSSDFTIELQGDGYEFPDEWCCWVNSVSFPVSFFNISGNNNVLYILERTSAVPGTIYRRGVAIPEAQYTLAELSTALQTALNSTTNAGIYTVTISGQTLGISSTEEFRLPSRYEMSNPQWKVANWDTASFVLGPAAYSQYSPYDLRTINGLLTQDTTAWGSFLSTGVIDLAVNHSVYLHSNLANFSTCDSQGRKTCIARIPIEVSYGFTQQHRHNGLERDCVDVSNQKFRNVSFRLANAFNQTVDLRGGHVAIELVFGPAM